MLANCDAIEKIQCQLIYPATMGADEEIDITWVKFSGSIVKSWKLSKNAIRELAINQL